MTKPTHDIPQEGGRYIRAADGKLMRASDEDTPAPAPETRAAESAAKPAKGAK